MKNSVTVALGLVVLVAGLSGCSATRPITNLPGIKQVSQSMSSVTRGFTNSGKRLYAGAKQKGEEVSKDVAKYTTKLPGARHSKISDSELRAINQYQMQKSYQESMRKYTVPSQALPRGGQIITSP